MNVKRKICHITYNLTKCCIETEYRQAVSRKVSVKFLQETATEVKQIFYICSAKPKKLRILHYVSKIWPFSFFSITDQIKITNYNWVTHHFLISWNLQFWVQSEMLKSRDQTGPWSRDQIFRFGLGLEAKIVASASIVWPSLASRRVTCNKKKWKETGKGYCMSVNFCSSVNNSSPNNIYLSYEHNLGPWQETKVKNFK